MLKNPNKVYLLNSIKKKKLLNFKFALSTYNTLTLFKKIIFFYNYKYFYLYLNNYFFFIFVGISFAGCFRKKAKKLLYFSFCSLCRYFFLKIKFYGKTFKWLFFKNRIKFKVQKAHKVILLVKNLKFKKKKKLKFKLRLYNLLDKHKLVLILKQIKYINIFTKKGLRVLKTLLLKKKGKISGYMNKYV